MYCIEIISNVYAATSNKVHLGFTISMVKDTEVI